MYLTRLIVAEIRYLDTVTFKHKDTKVYLTSHEDKYPLKYEDGRISSQGEQTKAHICAVSLVQHTSIPLYPSGQQVVARRDKHLNNNWQILPTREIPETGRGRVIRQHDIIQLVHVETDTLLLT